ncbi:MAG: VanW family protein, partial [Candidatus Ornithomonoglobus sp.]
SGDIFYDGFENTLMLFKKHTIIPDADVDEALLRKKITEFGNSIYGELTQHSLEIGDGVVICTPGHSGFDNNTDAAYSEILSGLKNDQHIIPVVLKEGHPDPVTAKDVDNFVYCDPADAYYKKENGTILVENEVYGRYLDLAETEWLISGLSENGDIIYIPYYTTPPEITAEQLDAKLFNAVIGSYSTNYGTSSANRCANISNAASKINETALMPGDVFSFNETVGPRSAANGFYTAKEYVNGDTVDGIGGGTCQVSSTLYNAVLYSDLSIVSRTNHMFPVDYCPIGQDATVADTGVDFKFVNSMNYPIKISAVTSGYTVTVSIIGTERDDPRTVKIENTTTKSGSDTSVHSVRYVYNSAGELIQTDDLGNSYYMAHDN